MMNNLEARQILVVDDDELIFHALRRSLQGERYLLSFALSPVQALNRLQQKPVDIVISDYLMPEANGIEFLTLVRDRFPNSVRLMLTGCTDQAPCVDALHQGVIFRLLEKPWHDLELKMTLLSALDKGTGPRPASASSLRPEEQQ